MTVDPFDDRVCNCGKTGCLELGASTGWNKYQRQKNYKRDFKSDYF